MLVSAETGKREKSEEKPLHMQRVAAPTKPAKQMLLFDCVAINLPRLLGNAIAHFHALAYWDS